MLFGEYYFRDPPPSFTIARYDASAFCRGDFRSNVGCVVDVRVCMYNVLTVVVDYRSGNPCACPWSDDFTVQRHHSVMV